MVVRLANEATILSADHLARRISPHGIVGRRWSARSLFSVVGATIASNSSTVRPSCDGMISQSGVSGTTGLGVCSHVGVTRVVDLGLSGSSSFDEFYAAELPRLISIGLALSGDREIACDAAQETMLRAYQRWDRVATLDKPGAWARRVLINLCTDVHRRRGRERVVIERLGIEPESLFGEPAADQLWEAVRRLPPRQRSVIALRYIDDFTTADIAAVLKVTIGTVTKSLVDARRSLGDLLKEESS